MTQARIQVGFIQHEPGRPHLGRAAYVFIYTGRIAREPCRTAHAARVVHVHTSCTYIHPCGRLCRSPR